MEDPWHNAVCLGCPRCQRPPRQRQRCSPALWAFPLNIHLCSLSTKVITQLCVFNTSLEHQHRRQNEAAIVGSVISALQPTIAEAVAAALAASSRPSSTTSSSSSGASSSGFVPARDSDATPANYNYIYKVADDGTQTYISQEEQRDVSQTTRPFYLPSNIFVLCRALKCRARTAMSTRREQLSLSTTM